MSMFLGTAVGAAERGVRFVEEAAGSVKRRYEEHQMQQYQSRQEELKKKAYFTALKNGQRPSETRGSLRRRVEPVSQASSDLTFQDIVKLGVFTNAVGFAIKYFAPAYYSPSTVPIAAYAVKYVGDSVGQPIWNWGREFCVAALGGLQNAGITAQKAVGIAKDIGMVGGAISFHALYENGLSLPAVLSALGYGAVVVIKTGMNEDVNALVESVKRKFSKAAKAPAQHRQALPAALPARQIDQAPVVQEQESVVAHADPDKEAFYQYLQSINPIPQGSMRQ